jgi:hypothetical protein
MKTICNHVKSILYPFRHSLGGFSYILMVLLGLGITACSMAGVDDGPNSGPGSTSAIRAFRFTTNPPALGTIDPEKRTVTVTVPRGTDLTSLAPNITVSDDTAIEPKSGVPQSFFNGIAYTPVTYKVTPAGGSSENWTVTVKWEPLASAAAVKTYLSGAKGGDAAAAPIPLPLTINLADPGGNGWTDVLTAIQGANKYVILDLSACTMSGAEFDPGADNAGCIVSLILPDAAAGIKAGTAESPAFQYFTDLRTVSGKNIARIGSYAFADCFDLATVSLPAARIIGSSAFSRCYALATVSLPAAPPVLEPNVFSETNILGGTDTTLTIRVPQGAVDAYTAAAGWGVSADTADDAAAAAAKYGVNHKRIVIDAGS